MSSPIHDGEKLDGRVFYLFVALATRPNCELRSGKRQIYIGSKSLYVYLLTHAPRIRAGIVDLGAGDTNRQRVRA